MKKICISFMAGMVIGMLIAPAKGSVTRRKIVDKFNDFTEDITDEAEQLKQSGRQLMGKVKEEMRDMTGETETDPGFV